MDCRPIRRDVSALIDGDLGPRRAEEVKQHLSDCDVCAAECEAVHALLLRADIALTYSGKPLSFEALRREMATIDPLEQVIRYQLPKLRIPGRVPRFAVAMILLLAAGGLSYTFRHTREVYVAVKTPFADQKTVLTAALEDGQFPWDAEEQAHRKRNQHREA